MNGVNAEVNASTQSTSQAASTGARTRTRTSKKQRIEPHEARCRSAPAEAELEGGIGPQSPPPQIHSLARILGVDVGIGHFDVVFGGKKPASWEVYAVPVRSQRGRHTADTCDTRVNL